MLYDNHKCTKMNIRLCLFEANLYLCKNNYPNTITIMALINCPECGKEISDKAHACPNCGNPMKQQSQQEEYLCCPICGSHELHAEHKGFSGGKALAGAILTGGIGLLAGTIGSKDTQITCLKCGKKFKAGEAIAVRNSDEEAKLKEKLEKNLKKNFVCSSCGYIYDNDVAPEKCPICKAPSTQFYTKYVPRTESYGGGNGCSIIILIGISLMIGAMTFL